jgi:hypothetical protein
MRSNHLSYKNKTKYVKWDRTKRTGDVKIHAHTYIPMFFRIKLFSIHEELSYINI